MAIGIGFLIGAFFVDQFCEATGIFGALTSNKKISKTKGRIIFVLVGVFMAWGGFQFIAGTGGGM